MQDKRRFSSFALLLSIVMAVVVSAPVIYGLLTSTTTIGNTGTIKTIGVNVYSDSACTIQVSSITWGTVEPGTAINNVVYIKNTGNAAATLTLSTGSWSPSSASGYMKLTWNYTGQSISPGSNIPVKLTLTLFANATALTSFSFNILITSSG
jgi:hypothetical protein